MRLVMVITDPQMLVHAAADTNGISDFFMMIGVDCPGVEAGERAVDFT